MSFKIGLGSTLTALFTGLLYLAGCIFYLYTVNKDAENQLARIYVGTGMHPTLER